MEIKPLGMLLGAKPVLAPAQRRGTQQRDGLVRPHAIVTLRRIGETESAAATVFWFNLVCIVVAALPMPFLFQNHTGHIWDALTLGGLMGGIAQIMMTAAVRYAPVSVLAPFDYLQIVWATIWDLFCSPPYHRARAWSAQS
jgi:EamA-like transporter family.